MILLPKSIPLRSVLPILMVLCGIAAVFFGYIAHQSKDLFLRQNAAVLQEYIKTEIQNVRSATQKLEARQLANFDFEQCATITNLLDITTPVYVYKDDSLVFWNNNQIDIHLPDEAIRRPTGAVSDAAKPVCYFLQNNGIDVVQCSYRLPTSGYLVVILVPIQYKKNASQLQYFKNEFVINLRNAQDLRITPPTETGGAPVFGTDTTPLFNLKTTQNQQKITINTYKKYEGMAILSMFFLLFTCFILHISPNNNTKNKSLSLGLFVVLVAAVRCILFYFKENLGINPEVNEFFSDAIFANSAFTPSLGDLLLHIFAFMFIAMYAYKYRVFFRNIKIKLGSRTHVFLPVFIDWLLANAITAYLLHIAHDLVINSNIPFGAADFFNLTTYSIAVYAIFIIVGGIAIYQVANTTLNIQRYKLNEWFMFFQIALILICLIPSLEYKRYIPALVFMVFISVFLVVFYFKKRRVRSILLTLFIAFTVAITLQTSMALYKKQTDRARIIAENIQYPTNTIAEKTLLEIAEKLQNDTLLLQQITHNTTPLKNIISNKYFTSTLKKYTFDSLYIKKGKKNIGIFDEINSLDFQGSVKSSAEVAKISHTATVPYLHQSGTIDTIFLSIYQYAFEEPNNIEKKGFNFDYSAAIYKNQRLTARKGNYLYNLKDVYFSHNNQANFSTQNDFPDVHIIQKSIIKRTKKYAKNRNIFFKNDVYYIIVSFKNPMTYDFFVGASSLLLAFLLAYYIFDIAYKFHRNAQFWLNINYRDKISTLLTASVIFTLVIIGATTVLYTFQKYKQSQYKNLTQRTDNLTVNTKDLDNQDFVFYDALGILQPNKYSNTQAAVPLSKHINPQAYYDIISLGKSIKMQPEMYGNLSYLVGYAPVLDANKNLVGVMGFPDFTSDEDLKDNLSGFLGTLLNIYVLILLLLLALIVFASARITAPLRLITRVISNTHLKQKLPKLDEITRNDEIGEMIREYYKKINEVEASAAQLAQAEKDLAWREMARQIAHEIRNPLTPMKLRLQHLQQVYKSKSDKFPALFEQVSSVVLEQINTLESVASEFGDYARTGTKPHTPLNLDALCQSAVHLYTQAATINYKNQTAQLPTIQGSDEELLRVLTNLIRNATQSRNDTENVEVNVFLYDNIHKYIIRVSDNGTGIPVEIQAKIFEPNFTTKTSGMGLGLAIVRRIVEHHGGKIHFDSTAQGTSFFVELPKISF